MSSEGTEGLKDYWYFCKIPETAWGKKNSFSTEKIDFNVTENIFYTIQEWNINFLKFKTTVISEGRFLEADSTKTSRARSACVSFIRRERILNIRRHDKENYICLTPSTLRVQGVIIIIESVFIPWKAKEVIPQVWPVCGPERPK